MQVVKSDILDVTKFGCKSMRYEPFRPDVLKALRKEHNLTQKMLSEDAGINLNTLKKIEAGNFLPSYETLRVLGRYFNLFFYAEWENDKSSSE